MADAPTQFSTISADAISYWIAAEMYTLAERRLVLGNLAKKYTLPQRSSKTMRIVRYKRFNLPTTTLTEGTPPDAVALATENVDVTVEQWGIVALLTDVAQITTEHPALQIAIDRVSQAMEQTIEREMGQVLLGGTNVFFGTAAANRAALDGTKYLLTTDIASAVAFLRAKGALDREGGLYVGVLPPQIEADMYASDSTFVTAASYSQVVRLNVGEIGTWGGVRWVRGNFLPYFAGVAVPAVSGLSSTVAGLVLTSSGSALVGAKIKVIARDITTNFERRISQVYTVGGTVDSIALTTPTSTNYVYDIYQTDTSAANEKLVFSGVAANTAKTIDATSYTNGTLKTSTSPPASGKEVFIAWVFGEQAFGRVELNGMSLASYLTPEGASYSNPLAQGRKCGAKIMWKSFIIDNDFFVRLEANSHYSANLPA